MKKLVALSVLGSFGCAALPPPPALPSSIEYTFKYQPTGEPLRYETKDETRVVEESYPIREHELYDSSGRYVGKDVEYGKRSVERQFHDWHVYQGATEIDPLSALYIARDGAFEAAYREQRDRVQKDHALAMEVYETEVKDTNGKQNLGLTLGIVGLAGMVGAGLLFAATRNDGADESGGATPLVTTVSGVASLGFMGLAVGGFYVRSKASREQNAAVSKAEGLARSQMTDTPWTGFRTEDHVRLAVEAKWPKPKAPPQEAAPPPPPPPPPPAAPPRVPVPEITLSKVMMPLADASIPNNKALQRALVALWTPDASGSTPPRAQEDFEREFSRSKLYWSDVDGSISVNQGNIVVYTDLASLEASEGKGVRVKEMSALEVLTLALVLGRGIYVHYEGSASVFTVIDLDRVAKLLGKASAPPKK